MTLIPPGRKHTVTIVVRGPKEAAVVKKYMKAIRKAIGRKGKIKQLPGPKKRKRHP